MADSSVPREHNDHGGEIRPLIGITTYGRDENNRYSLPAEYVESVRRAGGIPLLIPPGEADVAALMTRIDGLILAGGGDLDPALYAGRSHDTIYMVDSERDQSELALTHAVLRGDMPTLGICRGAQVINVACGGTLIEHLPDVVGNEIAHRNIPLSATLHPVQVKSDSRLADLLGAAEVVPASWHHQALREIGAGLRAVAWAPDGTIEAAEMDTHPWLFAIQWHPELTAAEDPTQQRLFDEFVQACRRAMSGAGIGRRSA